MVYLTVKSEFLNDLLDLLNTSIVNYISYNLEEQGKLFLFYIRLNHDLEIDQTEQIKFLMIKNGREGRQTFDIRKQTFNKNSVKHYIFVIY